MSDFSDTDWDLNAGESAITVRSTLRKATAHPSCADVFSDTDNVERTDFHVRVDRRDGVGDAAFEHAGRGLAAEDVGPVAQGSSGATATVAVPALTVMFAAAMAGQDGIQGRMA